MSAWRRATWQGTDATMLAQFPTPTAPMPPRAAELIRLLQLQPHPEGGHYREIFRAAAAVQPGDQRLARQAMTSIDFLLIEGECSAWHRVLSDEAWHLLEGGPLRLWLMPPSLQHVESVDLAPVDELRAPRHVVPAGWWQAAQPLSAFAYVGATVAPGFEFTDFAFMRDHPDARAALQRHSADLLPLLRP